MGTYRLWAHVGGEVMYLLKQLSSNRLFIYHLLRRSLRYHVSITAVYDWDVEDVYVYYSGAKGEPDSVGMTASCHQGYRGCSEGMPTFELAYLSIHSLASCLVNYEYQLRDGGGADE